MSTKAELEFALMVEQRGSGELMGQRDALRRQLAAIADRLDWCFEPTVPVTPIMAELVPTVRDAIIQLRQLSRLLKPANPNKAAHVDADASQAAAGSQDAGPRFRR
jgi:hypothetical protein